MTATCIEAGGRRHELEERKIDRRLSRRDATVLIDSMPIDRSIHKPKVIYRRVSKQRYGPKPKHGPPRPKYGSPKPNRKPTKKYRGKVSPKYGPPSHKKHPPKPRYGPSKRTVTKPTYGPPKKKPHTFPSNSYHPVPMGFGEPPSNFEDHRSTVPEYDDFQKPGQFQMPGFNDFQKPGFTGSVNHDFLKPGSSGFYKPTSNDFRTPSFSDIHKPSFNDFQKPTVDGFQSPHLDEYPPNQGYAEPPVDSYGAPLKQNLHDLTYPTAPAFPDSTSHFDHDTFSSTLQSWKSYLQDQDINNQYAFSNKIPAFIKPDSDVFVTPVPEDTEEELGLNSYSDIYNYRQLMKDKIKKKPYQNVKIIRKPWKGNKKQVDDEIIVGGQYAEPPARYVPKFQPSAPMSSDEDDFAPLGNLSDPELVASATNSPYVNYKNSNMAFSPQNLNDAFSIVDK